MELSAGRLADALARRLRPAAIAVALVIGAAVPATYGVVEYNAVATEANRDARSIAVQIAAYSITGGPLWRYTLGKTEYGTDLVRGRRVDALHVADAAGQTILDFAETTVVAPSPFEMRVDAPIVVNDRRIGTVTVRLLPRRLLWQGSILTALSATLGVALAVFIYRYPVAVVAGAERRVHDLVDRLNAMNGVLESRAAELQAKNAELDTFVYSVSHDLKAPLVAMDGMASLLLEDYGAALDDDARHYLGRLQANVRHMERLISDLLTLSRIGRESQASEAVGLGDVVGEFVAGQGDALRARGVKVVVQNDVVLHGVRRHIEQVLVNLLGNAVKYLGDQPAPVIEVGAVPGDGVVEVYVRDNGIGIDPAYHHKVFEIFQRLHDVEADGTGVGLAIVRKIVDAAGGRIWVESTPGAGATFRLTWPA